ncbi:CDP-glycerol glycerophosphotransferase family protein [Leuconostoc miyukkimchii]|uniref:CDP-glycerol glycerophosphotransferase family protein n=1 Tax=Leuconostoc miyukkimchii TaxID=910540 RepID=UPI001C7D5175|nr:CDP-glycerol glycerophosphotransferase family protein [Leuconostoc miyukkimchii]
MEKAQIVNITIINGELVVTLSNDYDMSKIPNILIKHDDEVIKIKPNLVENNVLFFSLNKVPFGLKQIIRFTEVNQIINFLSNHTQILPNSVVSLATTNNGLIYLNKTDRLDLQLLSQDILDSNQEIVFQLPVLKLVNRTIIFNDLERWSLYKNNPFGDFGYLIHTVDGNNYFKRITQSRKNIDIETQINFVVDKYVVEQNKLTVELSLPLSIEHALISVNDIVIGGQIDDSKVTFNFSKLDELPSYDSGRWQLQILTGGQLLCGEISFPKQNFIFITEKILISNKKLRLLGDLHYQKLPAVKAFDMAGNVSVSIIQTEYGTLSLKFSHLMNQVELILRRRGKNIFKRFNGKFDFTSNAMSFNMSLFFDENTAILAGRRWDLYIISYLDDKKVVNRLVVDDDIHKQKHLNYGALIENEGVVKTTYNQKFQFYITEKKQLSLVKNSESKLIAERFNLKAELINLNLKINGKFKFLVSVQGDLLSEIKFGNILLVNRNTQSYDKIDLPTRIIKNTKKEWAAQATLKLDNKKLVPFYWDIYIEVVDENGRQSLVKIEKAAAKVRNIVRKNALHLQIRRAGQLLAPYVTVNNNLAFVYHATQDFETRFNYLKENMARVIEKIFRKQLKNKHIWISYEKNAMGAHDNAFAFFEYMYNHEHHDQFYYVIRKDSPEFKNLANMNNRVLKFMSLKYFIYMFSSELFISSDTKYHGYNLHQRDSWLGQRMSRVKEVYLQHGVNGLKQVPAFHKKRGLLDFIVVPDEYERRMVLDQWGYDEHQVTTTGLARWDKYTDLTDTIPYKQIFVMPTWRKWMDGMTPEKFVETPFYQQYQQFLSSPKLKELLTKNNTRIAFFLHPYFKNYVHLFKVDKTIIDQHDYLDVDMGKEIQKSSMMISDYSSVLWDMYYLEKPVLFYQFDRSEYLLTEKSYMDYETELFGDETFDFKETIEIIEEYIKRDFLEKDQYKSMRNKYFSYMDNNNSERIYHAIKGWKK